MLMLGSTHTAAYTADLAAATNEEYLLQVGRAILPADVTFRTGPANPEPLDYSLSDLEFRIVRYLMPTEFYSSLANSLGNGVTYNYGFQIIVFIQVIL